MPKRQFKIKVRLPEYHYPRNAWRKEIHQVVQEEMTKSNVSYTEKDKLELQVTLYFDKRKINSVDVDNRLKDIMDALQGHVGGAGKKKRQLKALIPNDNQIYKIVTEKSLPPKQSHGLGHLVIRKYQ